jgi:hypothetical protein
MKIVVMLLLVGLTVSVPTSKFVEVLAQCGIERKIFGPGSQC